MLIDKNDNSKVDGRWRVLNFGGCILLLSLFILKPALRTIRF